MSETVDQELNLRLWESVAETDTNYTKSEEGRFGTSINPAYMIKQATKVWGPIGIGWGYEILEARFDQGAPIHTADGAVLGYTSTHTVQIELWYKQGEATGRVPQFGHCPAVVYQDGWRHDPEAPKKSVTNGLKKCLSLLGFSADIYLGMYDDEAYRAEISNKFESAKSDEKDQASIKEIKEYNQELSKALDDLATAETITELDAIQGIISRKAEKMDHKSGLRRIIAIRDKRAAVLEDQDKGSTEKTPETSSQKADGPVKPVKKRKPKKRVAKTAPKKRQPRRRS